MSETDFERLREHFYMNDCSLHGRNTIEHLDVSLPELYALRRSRSNTIGLVDVDRHLSNRPDYLIWRLIRERKPHTVLQVPAGFNGGVELLLDCLRRAADSNNRDIKWCAFGLIARAVLHWSEISRPERFVRMPARLNSREIPDEDRLTDETFADVVKWMRSRCTKFARSASTSVEHPLRANRRQTLPQDLLMDAEQHLLLALGQLSICQASICLDGADDDLLEETFKITRRHLSLANGGWWPGQPIYAQNLQHYRAGYRSNLFSSCYLPFGMQDYNQWISDAFGRWAGSMGTVTNARTRRALFVACSSVLHREWLFARSKPSHRRARGNPLMVALDRTSRLAAKSGLITMVGGLAARYLAVGNQVGWDDLGRHRATRILRSKSLKTLARMSGCIVEGDAANIDFSLLANQPGDNTEFEDLAEEYRYLLRSVASTRMLDQPQGSNTPVDTETAQLLQQQAPNSTSDEQRIADLAAVATALGMQPPTNITGTAWLDILKCATVCLTPGKGESQDDLENLLKAEGHLFRACLNGSVVGCIALLAGRLQERGRLAQSAFGVAGNVAEFASLLLIWLEHSYMADLPVRADWQRQLLQAYTQLSDDERQRIRLDQKLLVYAAVSHVTASAMKSLGESDADQLEESIYEAAGEVDEAFRGLSTKSNLRVRRIELRDILAQQRHRGRHSTGFAHLMLSPDAKLVTVLLAWPVIDYFKSTEISVPFAPGLHAEVDYTSWQDLAADVANYDYSNDVTGQLNSYELSPLGHQSVRLLWQRIIGVLHDINGGVSPEHLLLVPDSALASIPWQLVAMENATSDGNFPLVTMTHGLRWLYVSAHTPEEAPSHGRFHDRGIQVWIANTPTPRTDLDIRQQISTAFFEATPDSPSLTDFPGVSLSVVFGHGTQADRTPVPDNEAVRKPQEWRQVRGSRICLLLSCYTGTGIPGALGDYLSISHKLCRTSKAVIAPPVAVPYTAALTLATVFNEGLSASMDGQTWRILEAYKEALSRNPAVALFSLWGISYEPLVWQPRPQSVQNEAPKGRGPRDDDRPNAVRPSPGT